MTEIENKIKKIKESNIDEEDKDALIASYLATSPDTPYLFTKNYLSSLKTFDTIDEFDNLNKESKDARVTSFMSTNPDAPYLFTNNYLSSLKTFDTIDTFNNIADVSSKIKSDINSKINSNINNSGGIFNSSSSYSNSSFSSTNSNGNTVVHNDNISNINGKVNRTSNCYRIDKEGNRTDIECNNAPNKKSSLKKENFSNTNNYGKTIYK